MEDERQGGKEKCIKSEVNICNATGGGRTKIAARALEMRPMRGEGKEENVLATAYMRYHSAPGPNKSRADITG